PERIWFSPPLLLLTQKHVLLFFFFNLNPFRPCTPHLRANPFIPTLGSRDPQNNPVPSALARGGTRTRALEVPLPSRSATPLAPPRRPCARAAATPRGARAPPPLPPPPSFPQRSVSGAVAVTRRQRRGRGGPAGGRWEMAEYLASIFGTEKDKVNCSFYFKIGACRHGDRCSRLHNKPTFSQEAMLL
uniref:U2 small nuclear RNA auxiliary factor 1 n=1 Tax=Corvus moneduloides TaxID=1196302 RepID=A0A8U7MTL8_CORMO